VIEIVVIGMYLEFSPWDFRLLISCEAGLGIDILLEKLAWAEGDDSPWGNRNFFSRTRISPFSFPLASYNEITKSRDLDGLSILKSRFKNVEDVLHHVHGLGFGNPNLFTNRIGNICLSHSPTPALEIMIMLPWAFAELLDPMF
jgi:hypothetical protein